jgi:hypothetical protein
VPTESLQLRQLRKLAWCARAYFHFRRFLLGIHPDGAAPEAAAALLTWKYWWSPDLGSQQGCPSRLAERARWRRPNAGSSGAVLQPATSSPDQERILACGVHQCWVRRPSYMHLASICVEGYFFVSSSFPCAIASHHSQTAFSALHVPFPIAILL